MEIYVRTLLIKRFHDDQEQTFGRELKYRWMSDPEVHGMFKLDGPTPQPEQARHYCGFPYFCNKLTAFYWAQSAQHEKGCDNFIFACIYKAWFRCHDNTPNIKAGHFFASPIRVMPAGPESIDGLLKAHRSLCSQLASKASPASRKPLQDDNVLPLFRAIILVFDQVVEPDVLKGSRLCLDQEVQRQNVLLILTGDNNGLNVPICFDAIRADSLETARPDVPSPAVDMIRIPLKTAIQFVANLQQQQDAAAWRPPSDPRDSSVYSAKRGCYDADDEARQWADRIIRRESPHDIAPLRIAVDKIEGLKRGEKLPSPEFLHWSPRWF
ncbi:MAG: hypothetical protein Q9166_000658 [cf. Caloplaca sp. 2 TL-2023]